ncbi:hypothetical protein [Catellatospora vulcania]|uniref:hypothetical protein n=1 Tax=Catellatospora vulcania TaxID=1460450 RepID=UPI0012D40E0D|nr:hypothetical protein [Catellatospora vulcania]
MMRFWGRLLAAAFGMAALVGAAQFGVVYGLDVLRLDREFTAGTDNDWNLQLTWVVWFTIVAVAGGATFAAGLALRDRRRIGAAVRIVTALAAALGAAAAAFPLTLQPAQYARLSATFDPELTAAIAVAAGVVAGLFVALLAVGRMPLSANLWACTGAVWLLAILSYLDTTEFGRNRDAMGEYYDPMRLGVLDISGLQPIPRASFSMPVIALLVALACGLVARHVGRSRLLIALSGAVGPLPVAMAYVIGGPGISRALTDQADAYLGAMIAVIVGLIVSSVIALAPRRPGIL